MRMRLLREGVVTVDGRMITEGAVAWEPAPLPLIHDRVVVGVVEDVRREADGWVTGDVSVSDAFSGDLPSLAAEVDLGSVTWTEGPEKDRLGTVTSARLISVTLGSRPCWSSMKGWSE